MARTKPGQKIHVDILNTALEKLEKLETKPKSELNLRESIFFLKDKLNSALKKGYSYQDLSKVLEEQKILISAATLKQYLTDISKKKYNSRKKKSKLVSNSRIKVDTPSSTNITNFKEELASSNSQAEITRIRESNSIDPNKSIKTKAKTKSQTKPKVFSGFDDDLSDDFNS